MNKQRHSNQKKVDTTKNAENHLDEKEAKWFAIYTKYKREKMVAKELAYKNIQAYLPLQKVLRQWERKKRTVELPLISCYLFVKITKPEYIQVLETEHVVRFVQFSRNLISIPEEEIEIVKRIVGEEIQIEPQEITYLEGDEVEIVTGNLTGLRGKLIEKQGNHNFVIELNHIGYALRMGIDPNLLRKVSKPLTV